MGKNRERVRFCFTVFCFITAPDAAETDLRRIRGGPQFIASERITPRTATTFKHDTAFKKDYYAVKSHYVPTIAPRLALPNPSRRASRRLSSKIRLSREKIITR